MTRSVAVLLDAPRPEYVPAGLSLAVGEKYAVRLLRVIARRTIESIETVGLEPAVWFTPPDALAEMRRWLGDAITLTPRASGTLGDTVAVIARQAGDGPWLVARPVGAGLTPELISRAARAVDDGGIVFGATTREDLYLLGGPAEGAALVQDLPWGRAEVAVALRSHLREIGAGWAELPRLVDLATAEDLRHAGLLT